MDKRYLQIAEGAREEYELGKSLRSFQGFGRSTKLADELSRTGSEYQKKIGILSKVIELENLFDTIQNDPEISAEIKAVQLKAIATQLNSAQNDLGQLLADSERKRIKLSQELMGSGRTESAKTNRRLQMSAGNVKSRKPAKVRIKLSPAKIKNASSNIKSIRKSDLGKPISAIRPLKGIKGLIASERRKKLSSSL